MDPLSDTILMFAARCEHIKSVIKPKLESDITVVSDRFTDAPYAYQHGGKGIDLKTIDLLKKLIQKELEPDLTFLFDLPVNVSIERLKKQEKWINSRAKMKHSINRYVQPILILLKKIKIDSISLIAHKKLLLFKKK